MPVSPEIIDHDWPASAAPIKHTARILHYQNTGDRVQAKFAIKARFTHHSSQIPEPVVLLLWEKGKVLLESQSSHKF